MALPKERIQHDGETAYAWERDAIDFVVQGLPDVDPYTAWNLVEFIDPTTGRLYELDMLVLSRQSLFVVEIKSHPRQVHGRLARLDDRSRGKAQVHREPAVPHEPQGQGDRRAPEQGARL